MTGEIVSRKRIPHLCVVKDLGMKIPWMEIGHRVIG